MEYTIDDPDQIVDYWSRLFEALSVKQFEKFSKRLEFPGQIYPDLRKVSKNFSLSYQSYLGRPIPEPLSDPLFDQSSEVDPLIQIWTNTFAQLELLGLTDLVYAWGQKLYPIVTHRVPEISMGTEWDLFLIDWARDPIPGEFPPINLPFKVVGKLQLIITHYEMESWELRFEIKQAEETHDDAWQAYAFKKLWIGSWIYNVARSFRELSKWKTIFSTLSRHDLEILDKWGHDFFIAYNVSHYFPLVQFADVIKAIG